MTKLIYTNSNGDSVEFSADKPYILQKQSGLGGVKSNIYSIKSPGQDGKTIIGSDIDTREITIQGVIVTSSRAEMELSRRRLIKTLNPKFEGTLSYYYDDIVKSIKCRVEEAPVFGSESVLTQAFDITILCADPFWTDTGESKSPIAAWLGEFEFPLELSANTEMGMRTQSLIVNVNNPGDVPCGMKIQLLALASVTNPVLLNVDTQEYIRLNRTMQQGESIMITTGFGEKRVESTLNGVTSNIFNAVDYGSTFLQLDVGDNMLRYGADVNANELEVSIYYKPRYLGVG